MNGLKKFLQLFSSKCAGTGADRIQDDRVAKGICLLSGKDAGLYFGNVRIQLGSGNFADKLSQVPPILAKLQHFRRLQAVDWQHPAWLPD